MSTVKSDVKLVKSFQINLISKDAVFSQYF